jgi:chorismate mutase
MALVCRGLRGATTARDNTKEAILEATHELLERLVEANELKTEDLAATFFTTSQDLNAEFPAVAARQMGWEYVPLICGHEMRVPDGLPLCIRVMILVNTEKRPEEMAHVYLHGAKDLRSRGTS